MNTHNTKKVFDYSLVAFLLAHGISYTLRPEDDRGGRIEVAFFVPDTEEVARLITQFHEDKPIQEFLKSIREVKDDMMPIVRGIRNGHIFPRRSPESGVVK